MGAAAITVTCASGPVITSTTSATGSWSVDLPAGTNVPCMVKAVGGTPTVTLYSLAQSTGSVNVTPLTNLVVAAAAGDNPEDWMADHAGLLSTKLPELSAGLAAAKDAVKQSLTNAGYTLPAADFMTATFDPKPGDPLDDLLEAVAASLAATGTSYADLVAQIADAGTTPVVIPKADVITAAQVAAQPTLNSGSIAVETEDGQRVAVLRTGTPTNSPGAYFGGGIGNKSVLQIPGLGGMKLADLQTIDVEFKPNSLVAVTPTVAPYLYINIMIDMDCSAPPLAANATAQQVRERRRILIYDPIYKFVYDMPTNPLYVQGQWATLSVTKATGGWRISAGAMADPTGQGDTGVEEAVHGSSFTLTPFNYTAHPNACIVDNVPSADGGLFRNRDVAGCATNAGLPSSASGACGKPHAGFLLNLGDSGVTTAASYSVRKVKVNDRVFVFQ
jgi:hypothetical protein